MKIISSLCLELVICIEYEQEIIFDLKAINMQNADSSELHITAIYKKSLNSL